MEKKKGKKKKSKWQASQKRKMPIPTKQTIKLHKVTSYNRIFMKGLCI
jgi:hypothetical protein